MSVHFEKVLRQVAMAEGSAEASVRAQARSHGKGRRLEEVIRAGQVAGDRIAICLGLALSLGAVALPLYIIQTSDGRPSVTPVLPIVTGDASVTRSVAATRAQYVDFDPETTGSLPRDTALEEAQRHQAQTAKMPSSHYVIRTVSKGLAVVEGPDGMWVVKPGMSIPGAGQVLSIEESGLGWVVVTSMTVIGQAS